MTTRLQRISTIHRRRDATFHTIHRGRNATVFNVDTTTRAQFGTKQQPTNRRNIHHRPALSWHFLLMLAPDTELPSADILTYLHGTEMYTLLSHSRHQISLP